MGVSEFFVEHQEVRNFSRAVDTLARGASTARTYHTNWCQPTSDAPVGIFRNFIGASQSIFGEADETLLHMGRTLTASALELGRTADYYERTDEETAAQMDAEYPG